MRRTLLGHKDLFGDSPGRGPVDQGNLIRTQQPTHPVKSLLYAEQFILNRPRAQ